jgi:hypothetical protein
VPCGAEELGLVLHFSAAALPAPGCASSKNTLEGNMIRIVGRILDSNIDPHFCMALRLLYSMCSANDLPD